MRDKEIIFFINGIRGHAFFEEPMSIKFDEYWYRLISTDASMLDKFDNRYDSISIANYNRKTSTLDRFTVAYDENGLKAATYNDKYYIAQFDDVNNSPVPGF